MDVVHTQNFFGSRECVRMAEKEAAGGRIYDVGVVFYVSFISHAVLPHLRHMFSLCSARNIILRSRRLQILSSCSAALNTCRKLGEQESLF